MKRMDRHFEAGLVGHSSSAAGCLVDPLRLLLDGEVNRCRRFAAERLWEMNDSSCPANVLK